MERKRGKAWLLAAGVCGVLLLCWHSHFRFALVFGESMQPGLRTGDLLLFDKRAYDSKDPRRGDIVVARLGKEIIVKRVVGLPGEEVALKGGHVVVNGAAIEEGHAVLAGALDISPGILFQGKYALLGDNRDVGIDQLVHAVVPKDRILGKVIWAARR